MKEVLHLCQEIVAPVNIPLHPRPPPLKGAKQPHPLRPARAASRPPQQRGTPHSFQKIMTRLRGPSAPQAAPDGRQCAVFPSKHPMETPIHGMPPPFHGVFPMEKSHQFVTYSGENRATPPLREAPPKIRRSCSASSHFRPAASAPATAWKWRSHAAPKIRFRAVRTRVACGWMPTAGRNRTARPAPPRGANYSITAGKRSAPADRRHIYIRAPRESNTREKASLRPHVTALPLARDGHPAS